METLTRRPKAMPSRPVAQTAPQVVVACNACRHRGDACRPGLALLGRLRMAVTAAAPGAAFEISGTACLEGCLTGHGRPCVVGWRVTSGGAWLFGDIDHADSIADLVTAVSADGSFADGPQDFGGRARRPAAVIVTREGTVQ
jgi:predicted metal-binding protein